MRHPRRMRRLMNAKERRASELMQQLSDQAGVPVSTGVEEGSRLLGSLSGDTILSARLVSVSSIQPPADGATPIPYGGRILEIHLASGRMLAVMLEWKSFALITDAVLIDRDQPGGYLQ